MNEDRIINSIRNLHRRVKEVRMAKGFTQAQMAEKLDIALRVYQHWEGGKKDYRVGTLFRIAQALGCKPADFFKKPILAMSGPGRPSKKKPSKRSIKK